MEKTRFDGLTAASEIIPEIVERAKAADERMIELVRARPLVALCTALCAGYVLGRLVSRYG